jgi:hypothetical protein
MGEDNKPVKCSTPCAQETVLVPKSDAVTDLIQKKPNAFLILLLALSF